MGKSAEPGAAREDRSSEVTPLFDIVEARVLGLYRIWVRFEDGVTGEVDVSDLVGKGVFRAWNDPAFFESMYVDRELGTVAWPGEIDLAPDAIYDDLTAASESGS